MSDGVYQTEREFATGTTELGAAKFGAKVKPFALATVLWQRSGNGNISLFVELLDGDRVYVIDTQSGGAGFQNYCLPNVRVPNKVFCTSGQRIRVRSSGAAGGENQSAAVTWAEEGTP